MEIKDISKNEVQMLMELLNHEIAKGGNETVICNLEDLLNKVESTGKLTYNEIEDKYIKAEVQGHYRFANASEVKAVLGYDLKKIRGFKALSDEDKILSERLMCNFINGHGLEARERLIITKVKREKGKFTTYYGEDGKSYSYLFDSGSIG